MTGLDTSDPRDSAYGREYWLHRCEGFRVESAGREVGSVHGLRFTGSIEPDLLEVRAGLFRRRVLLIPVERVEEIFPEQKRIIVGAELPRNRT
jgi:hypothetical protein